MRSCLWQLLAFVQPAQQVACRRCQFCCEPDTFGRGIEHSELTRPHCGNIHAAWRAAVIRAYIKSLLQHRRYHAAHKGFVDAATRLGRVSAGEAPPRAVQRLGVADGGGIIGERSGATALCARRPRKPPSRHHCGYCCDTHH